MSVILGEYQQNGYAVPDLDQAIAKWSAVGVGPFYRLDALPVVDFRYQDSTVAPGLDVALGNFGNVQIELIHPLDNSPSPYRDFLTTHPPGGLHHVSVWSDNYDSDLARWAEQGLVPDCTGEVGGFARFCYFRSSAMDGTAIEVADVGSSELFRQVSALIRDAARTWDGSRPIRSPDELYAQLGS